MFKLDLKWWAAAAMTCAALAGCGGGGGDGGGLGNVGVQTQQPSNPATSAQGVVDYLLALIANETSDVSEPKIIDGIGWATEELAEPSSV